MREWKFDEDVEVLKEELSSESSNKSDEYQE